MIDLRSVWDVTGANLNGIAIPPGITPALYVTGSEGVPATPGQLARYPGAVQIDQAPANTPADELADMADMENGAVTLADLPGWYTAAIHNYRTAARPGQRLPGVYCSYSRRTDVANTFLAAGITGGPRLWLADWGITVSAAVGLLTTSGGPFPVVGVQHTKAGSHDESLFLAAWLDAVSRPVAPPSPYPAEQEGVIVSFTTKGTRRVISTDHGETWR